MPGGFVSHRERLALAWSFREPDRVPIEMGLSPELRRHPKAGWLAELVDQHADNFVCLWGVGQGFLGFPSTYRETVIEDRPGEYRRLERVHETLAGAFRAVTVHPAGDSDFHWEKRFVSALDDLRRLAETPRPPIPIDPEGWRKASEQLGDRGFPLVSLFHPLGALVRNATMEEMYAWLCEERDLVHRYLAAANDQVARAVEESLEAGIGPCFITWAHEMFIPPWLGQRAFDEFVFPYDKRLADVIHRQGGKWRIHCHGRCMEFLEKFADMGLDAIEPLEPPPAGDVDLAEAKRRVGHRMMLSGNILAQWYARMTPQDVRQNVQQAILTAAPGGGFSLRDSSGGPFVDNWMSPDDVERVLKNCEEFVLAGLEYGQYPIG